VGQSPRWVGNDSFDVGGVRVARLAASERRDRTLLTLVKLSWSM
jgi:hypothetical protein